MERLDKILASQNFGSRKECALLIRRSGVTVNGAVVKKPEAKADPETDVLSVNGEEIRFQRHIYIMLNKPRGVLSASRDNRAPTVLDLLPDSMRRKGLFPAGRLDKDTEGLMIITDDGDFAHKMLAPKNHVYKIYHAKVDAPVTAQDIAAFESGVMLDDMVCLPAGLGVLEDGQHPLVWVKIREGKFHQVKRMFRARGKTVLALKRVQMGGLALDPSLGPGESRELTKEELKLILNFANLY